MNSTTHNPGENAPSENAPSENAPRLKRRDFLLQTLTIAGASVLAGENVIAVHVAQRFKGGAQIYDVNLLDESDLS